MSKMENIVINHIEKVPSKINLDCAKFWFNTPNANSVLGEYQLGNVKETRMHDYESKNEYNINGNIINEEEIIGCNGDFYIGFYSEIAYLQLRVAYRCDDFTIVRYRSADEDAQMGEWNSDIKFIICHTASDCREAERNVGFRNLIKTLNEYEWMINFHHRNYVDEIIEEIEEDEIIEEIEEDEIIEEIEENEIIEEVEKCKKEQPSLASLFGGCPCGKCK